MSLAMLSKPWSRMGPFAVNSLGRLSPADATVIPTFSIRWRDRTVQVRMVAPDASDATGMLELRVELGQVSSTGGGALAAEQTARRGQVFAALREFPPLMPAGWSVALLPDHRVGLRAGLKVAMPLAAAELVSEMTLFLLALDPYLDIVDAAGLALPDPPG